MFGSDHSCKYTEYVDVAHHVLYCRSLYISMTYDFFLHVCFWDLINTATLHVACMSHCIYAATIFSNDGRLSHMQQSNGCTIRRWRNTIKSRDRRDRMWIGEISLGDSRHAGTDDWTQYYWLRQWIVEKTPKWYKYIGIWAHRRWWEDDTHNWWYREGEEALCINIRPSYYRDHTQRGPRSPGIYSPV